MSFQSRNSRSISVIRHHLKDREKKVHEFLLQQNEAVKQNSYVPELKLKWPLKIHLWPGNRSTSVLGASQVGGTMLPVLVAQPLAQALAAANPLRAS